MKINNETINDLRAKVLNALIPVAKEKGFNLDASTLYYNDAKAHLTVNFYPTENGNEVTDPLDQTAKYKSHLRLYGIFWQAEEKDLGLKDGQDRIFVGLAPKKQRHNYVFQDGKGQLLCFDREYFLKVKATGKR